jgi:hypothetical protein
LKSQIFPLACWGILNWERSMGDAVETTHWADLAENFKIQDAACLMAGVPPAKEMAAWSNQLPPEARYVFERLWKAYMQGAGVYRQPKLDSADFQKMLHGIGGNDFQAPTIVPARGLVIRHQNMVIAPSAELMRKRLESVRVSRDELHRWVKATGIRSAYSFAPVVNAPGAELSTQPAPAQNTATPAPVVAVGASGGIHSTKTRRDALTPVIELAQSQCRNPKDTAEVWAALLVLAEKKNAPLIGATEDGLQYLKNGSAENFSRKSLGKRLTR